MEIGIHEPLNIQGDSAPRGPVFLSSGFKNGKRWLDSRMWSDDFDTYEPVDDGSSR